MSQPRYGTQTRPDTTVSLATVALIVALVLPPVGVVLGIRARRRDGSATAWTAIALGIALTVVWLLITAYWIFLVRSADQLLPGPPIPY